MGEHSDKNPAARPLSRTGRSLPIALLRAREVVTGPIREMLAKSPVNEQKWRVLRVLEEGGPQDQNTIARSACLLLPSLTRILRAMEADALVSREEDPQDRRRLSQCSFRLLFWVSEVLTSRFYWPVRPDTFVSPQSARGHR